MNDSHFYAFVHIGPNRDVVVAENGNNRIQALDQEGAFIRALGCPGRGPGQFDRPTGIATDEGVALLVVDTGNHRVQAFSPARTGPGTTGAAARSEKDRAPGEDAVGRKSKGGRKSKDVWTRGGAGAGGN